MTDVQTEVPETAAAPVLMARVQVRLGDLGLAKENLRYAEPADEGVPQLADTILAAGVVIAPIVRAGRKGEEPFVALDGRRRRLGLLLLRDRGDITDDYQVECLLAETKALILMLVFVYAFFKFTWSAWQYNVLSILVGGMPALGSDIDKRVRYVNAAGQVAALAGESYNNGVRAYYFAIPLITWFMSPLVFLVATLIVTFVLYRREFSSPIMEALRTVRD